MWKNILIELIPLERCRTNLGLMRLYNVNDFPRLWERYEHKEELDMLSIFKGACNGVWH